MLKAIAQIGGLQLLTMLVHLARTKSLAVILGPEWIGVMAVVDRLLGIVVQTASLSLPYAAVRFLPELWTRAPDEFADLVGRMRVVVFGMRDELADRHDGAMRTKDRDASRPRFRLRIGLFFFVAHDPLDTADCSTSLASRRR